MHIKHCDPIHFCTQQKNEDVRPGGGGGEEAEEPHQGAGVGEEQAGDGGLEQKIEMERLSGHHEA